MASQNGPKPDVTTTSGLPLVGRDAVLADIKALLDQARASRGGLVLVSGESGIAAHYLCF